MSILVFDSNQVFKLNQIDMYLQVIGAYNILIQRCELRSIFLWEKRNNRSTDARVKLTSNAISREKIFMYVFNNEIGGYCTVLTDC